jgi:UDPglucose 6-dehydrogenase
MDVRSAELTKYAANAMLATKISFMNELSGIAEKVGADIEKVRQGIGSDSRIGFSFIYPGVGYGGSCFPKDVQALRRTAERAGARASLLSAVEDVNAHQKGKLFERIRLFFDGKLDGLTIALWGLAFKPNTDDMREAPSRVLMQALWDAGARVRAYDPVAMAEAQRLYPSQIETGVLTLVGNSMSALDGASALAIVTEWQEFRSPDFDSIKNALAEPVIFDGRNMYDPALMKRYGLRYFAIGRGESVQEGFR